jgi:hypothetical protein
MKKIRSIIIGIIIILSGLGGAAAAPYQEQKNTSNLEITVSFPCCDEYKISQSESGDTIELNGYHLLSDIGKPQLPTKTVLIALPPGSTLQSIDFYGQGKTQLSGTYHIQPASYPVPYDIIDNGQAAIASLTTTWQNNYDSIYSSDDAFPAQIGSLVGSGTLRKYSYVAVALNPIQYHPASGRLYVYSSVQIMITYTSSSPDPDTTQVLETMEKDTHADEQAADLFVNYQDMKDIYQPETPQQTNQQNISTYVIITTSGIAAAISSSDFLSWKQTLGYTVAIVNITDPGITGQPGDDLAARIRNFLRAHYLEWSIDYVLFIGDAATVPMRYCYPDPTNHENTAGTPGGTGGEVPTDYYYADLSNPDETSWDADGDDYYGEYGQDHPDFLPEVSVGRLPINDISRIQYTLDKTMAYEQDTSEWKTHALNVGAFFYFTKELGAGYPAIDGAVCPAKIEEDIMDSWTISHYSEQEGLEHSVYEWPPLNQTSFTTDWRTGTYAIVNWGAHGWSHCIAQKIWSWDDGDGIPEANEMTWPTLLSIASNLDDDYPSIVTAISCLVGYPEPNSWGNLGIDLLTKPSYGASVGVVSSARSPYGSLEWPVAPGGSDSIIYEFNNNTITNGQTIGDALFTSKYFCHLNYGWSSYYEYINMYTFNLFGDPSLVQQGINTSGRPNKPSTPIGEDSGKIRNEYEYTSNATDPDNDQISYMFSWGDGTESGWLGPVDSGAVYKASHVWNKKGTYQIKTRVKDETGLVSDWSEPLIVSMPRSSIFIYTHPILRWLIEQVSSVLQIVRSFFGYLG